jgi:hypothetical protein
MKVWRNGYLGFGAAQNWAVEIEALRRGLREVGFVEGKNLKIEFRWAEHADQMFRTRFATRSIKSQRYLRTGLDPSGARTPHDEYNPQRFRPTRRPCGPRGYC